MKVAFWNRCIDMMKIPGPVEIKKIAKFSVNSFKIGY